MRKKTIIPTFSNYIREEDNMEAHEQIDKLKLLFDSYFSTITCHSTLDAISMKDSLLCYCKGTNRLRGFWNEAEDITINVNSTRLLSDNIFFDSRDDVIFRALSEHCIRLFIKKEDDSDFTRYLGYYFPERNVLFATDWSHDFKSIELATLIKDKLIQKLGLKPIKKLVREKKMKKSTELKMKDITLGCDPEFESYDFSKRKVIVATWGDDISEIGIDGAGEAVEFRPEPSSDPRKIVKRLEKLFNQFVEFKPKERLLCSGNKFPLGGHIHIGVGKSYFPDRGLTTLFDDFIGKPFYDCSGKARGDYKDMNLFREQPWGFEYRTPPASIFHNKKITYLVLKIAKNLVYNYFNSKEIVYNKYPTEEDYINVCGLTKKEYKSYIYNVNAIEEQINNKPYLIAAWGKNKDITLDKSYKEVYSIVITKNDTWNEEIYEYFNKTIKEQIQPLINKAKINLHLDFFGYKTERGLVSNILVSKDWRKMDSNSTEGIYDNLLKLHVGLPWIFRTVEADYSKYVQAVINSLMENIKNSI